MEFINNFVCFEEQTLELDGNVGVLEVDSPFIRVTNAINNATITGLDTNIVDKSYLLFVINDSSNPITLVHNSNGVDANQRFYVSTEENKVISPGSYEVVLYIGNKLIVRDISLI